MAARSALVLVDGSVKQLPAGDTLAGVLSNPMTGVGDLIVGGVSGTPERLAPGPEPDTLFCLRAGIPAWRRVLDLENIYATSTGNSGQVQAFTYSYQLPFAGPCTFLNTQSNAAGAAAIGWGSTSNDGQAGGQNLSHVDEALLAVDISIPTLSGGTETFRAVVGWSESLTISMATQPAEGNGNQVIFMLEGDVLTTRTKSGASVTDNAWGTSLTADTTYRLRIEWRRAAGEVDFYVDNVLIATHTTNIPSTVTGQYWRPRAAIKKSAGTTSRSLRVGYPKLRFFL